MTNSYYFFYIFYEAQFRPQNSSNEICVKLAYDFIVDELRISVDGWWRKDLWQWKIPLKIKCFSWLCVNDKVSTWDNILKRGWVGTNIWQLC